MVPWEAADDVHEVMQRLQDTGVQIVAVEQSPQAVSLYAFTPSETVAYIFGNEVTGLVDRELAAADVILEIPLRGQKESLNVATTAGIVLFHHE